MQLPSHRGVGVALDFDSVDAELTFGFRTLQRVSYIEEIRHVGKNIYCLASFEILQYRCTYDRDFIERHIGWQAVVDGGEAYLVIESPVERQVTLRADKGEHERESITFYFFN